jgi:hypothetical protein
MKTERKYILVTLQVVARRAMRYEGIMLRGRWSVNAP